MKNSIKYFNCLTGKKEIPCSSKLANRGLWLNSRELVIMKKSYHMIYFLGHGRLLRAPSVVLYIQMTPLYNPMNKFVLKNQPGIRVKTSRTQYRIIKPKNAPLHPNRFLLGYRQIPFQAFFHKLDILLVSLWFFPLDFDSPCLKMRLQVFKSW
ncbi:MAG: hypothetical protein RBG13Loki_0935 [Promethearchaeota archaeon CR_4]|nr:MAG: hypothetical protein RBG13Loki_0935 [Candidatus Lokiarchaeota archaeon CR_4]